MNPEEGSQTGDTAQDAICRSEVPGTELTTRSQKQGGAFLKPLATENMTHVRGLPAKILSGNWQGTHRSMP